MSLAPSLKPIETFYRGYRFRSRLEARWAVFFEEVGEEWRYETEGFELPLGRYLPDFYLPKRQVYVEVKPGPRPTYTAPRVYMAGRMGNCAKSCAESCYRPFDVTLGAEEHYDDSVSRKTWLAKRMLGAQEIDYCGPWQIGWGSHSALHGVAEDGSGYESETLARSLDGIVRADIVFAMLEDLEAFGTLVEIGYAKGLNKKLIVGVVPNGVSYSEDYSEEDSTALILNGERCPIWFALGAADSVLRGSRENILHQFESWLANNYVKPREQILIEQLYAASGAPSVVVYGDPVEAFTDYRVGYFQARRGDQPPFFILWDQKRRDMAALKARQARFEHGQSGASQAGG